MKYNTLKTRQLDTHYTDWVILERTTDDRETILDIVEDLGMQREYYYSSCGAYTDAPFIWSVGNRILVTQTHGLDA